LRLRRVAALAAFALSGIVAAFATIQTGPADIPPARASLVEPLALDLAERVIPAPARYIREEHLQSGETVTGTVKARYFFGKPVAGATVEVK